MWGMTSPTNPMPPETATSTPTSTELPTNSALRTRVSGMPRERATSVPAARASNHPENAIIRDALALVGLDHLIDRRCDHLSGGERRRAVIARGLAQGADLILLDEPTNHLDVRHQLQLLETLRASGRTVVATIHDLSMAASHFDRVVVLADGGVLATGPAEEALSPSNVATAFHVIAHHVTTPEGSRELVCTAALPEPSRKEI